ncbi:unnamed protein product [Mytilus edulis]|uniref:Uncharacterized protein n=1 Tax=Mytilus edulis TaxID=6550 RepID=A0A8S3VH30_MYTED|nr:unnamed protein product [Mytilus edulis]
MVLPTPQTFGCSSSNSGQTTTSLMIVFYRIVLPTPQRFDCSSSNSGQQLISNDSFYRMVLPRPSNVAAVAVLIVDNNLSQNDADALKRLAVAVLIVDNNSSLMTVFYRMVLPTPQTFNISSSTSGQQLTCNDSFSEWAADFLKCLTVAVLIVTTTYL